MIVFICYLVSTTYNNPQTSSIVKSNCECRQNDNILIIKYQSDYEIITNRGTNSYRVTQKEMNSTNCNLFSTLRHGKHQKVLGFSLYGSKKYYSGLLPSTALIYTKSA